jgi:dinuclear metal center YbgI/SA1388 family protein
MARPLRDICSLIEKGAPLSLAEAWDNVGLQVGSLNKETEKVLLALDPTREALEKAHDMGAKLIITHHPLIFSPIKRIDPDCFPGDLLAMAVEKDITIVSYHTNLDRAASGINHALAQLLELKEITVLDPVPGTEGCGLGRIGAVTGSKTLSGLAALVAERLKTNDLRLTGKPRRRVRRAAVLGGSGGAFITLAHGAGADVLITGDVGYHHALEAERLGISVIDAGHFETERAAFRAWAKGLEDDFKGRGWEVDVFFFEGEHSPFTYIKGGRSQVGRSQTGWNP